jgi:hypothetical protein
MSVSQTHVPVVVADQNRRIDDCGEITVNPSAPPADDGEVTGRHMDDAPVQGNPMPVEQLIARVLGRAHRTAEALNAPDEARAILHVAHSFADELATTNPRFDRLRFIHAATQDPS